MVNHKVFIWTGKELRLAKILLASDKTEAEIRDQFLCGKDITGVEITGDDGDPFMGTKLDDRVWHDLNGWTVINDLTREATHLSIRIMTTPD